jgi:hypothetical protein
MMIRRCALKPGAVAGFLAPNRGTIIWGVRSGHVVRGCIFMYLEKSVKCDFLFRRVENQKKKRKRENTVLFT